MMNVISEMCKRYGITIVDKLSLGNMCILYIWLSMQAVAN